MELRPFVVASRNSEIIFPVQDAIALTQRTESRHPQGNGTALLDAPTHKPRILVADDNPDIAKVLQLLLHQWGYEVRTACDGMEAEDRAVEFKPDLLLADYDMPRRNGLQAALAIRRHLPGCRIVFLSGVTELHAITDELREERLQFIWLNKPVSCSLLQEKLQQALAGAAVSH